MAAVTKDSLIALLAHEHTRNALGRLAQGEDVRRVAADVAGAAIATKLGQMFGAPVPPPAPVDVNAASTAQANVGENRNVSHNRRDVVDAEYVTINVSDEAKKKRS